MYMIHMYVYIHVKNCILAKILISLKTEVGNICELYPLSTANLFGFLPAGGLAYFSGRLGYLF